MSNSIFQNVILQLKGVGDRTFGVLDADGCVIACTDAALLDERWTDAMLKITGSTNELIYRLACKLVRISALARQIIVETLLHDVTVFAIM